MWSILSIVVFFATASSQELKDGDYSGLRKPVYITYEDDHLKRNILPSTLKLHGVYLCTQEFRKFHHPKTDSLDFDELAKTYAKCYAKTIFKEEPSWVSLDGSQSELKRQVFTDLNVHLAMNDVTFSKQRPVSETVDISVRNIIQNNDSDVEVTNKVSHTVEKVTTTTTSSTHSTKTSISVEAGVHDPITESGASVKISGFNAGTSGSEKSDTDKVTYTISDASVVPARKTGRLIWTKTVSDVEMEWSAYIEVSGWVAAKVGNKLCFFPVADMTYVFDEYVTRLDLNTVGLTTTGKIKMTDAIISDATVDEYDNEANNSLNSCPDQFTNYTLPSSQVSKPSNKI